MTKEEIEDLVRRMQGFLMNDARSLMELSTTHPHLRMMGWTKHIVEEKIKVLGMLCVDASKVGEKSDLERYVEIQSRAAYVPPRDERWGIAFGKAKKTPIEELAALYGLARHVEADDDLATRVLTKIMEKKR